MFFETIRSPGLAHLSYLVGDGDEAAVIDPRRDTEAYLEIADREGARITHIFETHRHEDFVTGSTQLADRTGAAIHHGRQLPFEYGQAVREGDRFHLGDVALWVLETPGHTDESISLVLADTATSDEPLAVFTGDALFVGDVGRTDFFPERAEEVAGLLYDSLFTKVLPLGDHVLLYPAHGAGSVCGSGMADRNLSTLGYERRFNPALQVSDRTEFIARKIAEKHPKPPYFQEMERRNLAGPEPFGRLPRPKPLTAGHFAAAMDDGLIAIDCRSPEAIGGALVPGSLGLPVDMIAAYAGWFLPYDCDLGLIVDAFADVEPARRVLARLGYERLTAFLADGLHGWEVSGRTYGTIPPVHAAEIARRMEHGEPMTLVDVRKEEEVAEARLPGSVHLFLGDLPDRLDELPTARPLVTFCGSGRRAIIAASLLKRHGFEAVECCLGSLAACRAVGCPIDD